MLTTKDLRDLGYEVRGHQAIRVGSGAAERDSAQAQNSNAATGPLSPYRSKWEAERAAYHETRKRAGLIADYRYEAVRLKLADGAWYKADFLIQHNDGLLELEEVKGYWREAARVRYKVAVSLYPMFAFTVVSKQNGRWVELESRVGGWLEIVPPLDREGAAQ